MGIRLFLSISFLFVGMHVSAQPVSEELNTRIDVTYNVKKVNKINSAAAEFSPVIYGSDFIFASDRAYDLLRWGEDFSKKIKHINLFKATFESPKDDSVNFSKIELFDNKLPGSFHAGPICFNPSGNVAVVTHVISQKKKVNRPQLYWLKKENGTWAKPEKIPFCLPEFSYGHACFSSDGKRIYFSSDMSGTIGGKDLFMSEFNGTTFTQPVSMGTTVNTASDELYPFFQDNVLYFASDKAGGFGGLDVYSSQLKNGVYDQPVSLGPTLNSVADDFSFFLTPTGRNGFFASNREGMGGDDIYFFTVVKTATILSKNIVGRFTYARLGEGVPAGLELQLLDEAGNVVQKTVTDDKGGFRFVNLPADQDFTVRLVEINPDLVLHIYNKDGKEYAVLMSDSRGAFVYKKLEAADSGTLAFMQLDEAGGKLSGQFMHERMKGGSLEGINVMLVDEAGNVYARTVTDKNGNFTFQKLPHGQNFTIVTDSQYSDLKLLIYNSKDQVIADLKRAGAGPFVFRRINSNLDNSITMLDNSDVKLFPDNYVNLSGKFKLGNLSPGPDGELDFIVTDEAGNILQQGKADKKGEFILTGLPVKDVYIVKLAGDDAALDQKAMKLQVLDRFDEELQMIDGTDIGFVFNRKKPGVVVVPATADKLTVYFGIDESSLDEASTASLKPMADALKADARLVVYIDGHADASASEAHNAQLSQRRMLATKNYFLKKGIPAKRIKGAYYGKTRLVNGCTDYRACSDAENSKNRRCELRLEVAE